MPVTIGAAQISKANSVNKLAWVRLSITKLTSIECH
jgi:hypothetical protein